MDERDKRDEAVRATMRKRMTYISKIRALKEEGYSNAAIATKLGLPENSIRLMLK